MKISHGKPAVEIRRDPFARATLVREKAPKGCTCAECGRPARFRYGWWNDGIYTSPHFDPHNFCGIQCYRQFTS